MNGCGWLVELVRALLSCSSRAGGGIARVGSAGARAGWEARPTGAIVRRLSRVNSPSEEALSKGDIRYHAVGGQFGKSLWDWWLAVSKLSFRAESAIKTVINWTFGERCSDRWSMAGQAILEFCRQRFDVSWALVRPGGVEKVRVHSYTNSRVLREWREFPYKNWRSFSANRRKCACANLELRRGLVADRRARRIVAGRPGGLPPRRSVPRGGAGGPMARRGAGGDFVRASRVAIGDEAEQRWAAIEPAIFAQVFPAAGAVSPFTDIGHGPAMGITRPAVINVASEHQPNSLGTRIFAANTQHGDKKLLSAIHATGMRRKIRIIERRGPIPLLRMVQGIWFAPSCVLSGGN
jgi:hypothetical protein